jgi:hypothetical protein
MSPDEADSLRMTMRELRAENERGRTEIRELRGLLDEIRQAVNNVDSNANAEVRELADELIDKIDAIIGRDRQ